MSGAVRLAREARLAELHGEAVLLHVGTGRYFGVNATGTVLLRELALPEGATPHALADALVAHFDVERAVAEADVSGWLARLRDAGLLGEGSAT